mmetsp:Transcript_2162/g.5833  ORF Transcript_2162/g.5833 Transcript_2162/m.5833 type:complete len:236 (-) Transcript_2162:69-776(-)
MPRLLRRNPFSLRASPRVGLYGRVGQQDEQVRQDLDDAIEPALVGDVEVQLVDGRERLVDRNEGGVLRQLGAVLGGVLRREEPLRVDRDGLLVLVLISVGHPGGHVRPLPANLPLRVLLREERVLGLLHHQHGLIKIVPRQQELLLRPRLQGWRCRQTRRRTRQLEHLAARGIVGRGERRRAWGRERAPAEDTESGGCQGSEHEDVAGRGRSAPLGAAALRLSAARAPQGRRCSK